MDTNDPRTAERRKRTAISVEQMATQLEWLENRKAAKRASLAMDLNPEYPSYVAVEMKCRAMDALELMDQLDDMFDGVDLIDTQESARF